MEITEAQDQDCKEDGPSHSVAPYPVTVGKTQSFPHPWTLLIERFTTDADVKQAVTSTLQAPAINCFCICQDTSLGAMMRQSA
jgi:hypothetical protein